MARRKMKGGGLSVQSVIGYVLIAIAVAIAIASLLYVNRIVRDDSFFGRHPMLMLFIAFIVGGIGAANLAVLETE